jgi:ribosomal protein S8E
LLQDECRRKLCCKKWKYVLGCPAPDTKIGSHPRHIAQVPGGNKKYFILGLAVGNFYGSDPQ